MAALMAVAGLVGTGVQMAGTIAGGRSAKALADYESSLQGQKAAYDRATWQRQAEEERHKGELAKSRATMLMAASGAGGAETESGAASLSQLEEETYLNVMSSIAGGEIASNFGRAQASLTALRGKEAQKGSYLEAIGQGLKGLSKFGPDLAGTDFFKNSFGYR